MGEVILGMPGPWAEDYREESDHYTTKIGGLPDWPIPDIGIGLDLLKCGLCGERLCLVAQVYAPISMPKLNIEERVIYILGCSKPKCGINSRSWRAIRVQKCHGETHLGSTNPKAIPLGDDSAPISKSSNWWEEGLSKNSFGEHDDESDGDADSTPFSKIGNWREEGLSNNGFGDDENNGDVDLGELSRALSKAASQASHSKKQTVSIHSEAVAKALVSKPRIINVDASIPVVPCFYIYSQKEQSPGDVSTVCASYLSLSIKGNESPRTDLEDEERWEGETYEYDRALGADRSYLKFKKQMDAYPEQCFRYSYGGNPLLATTDLVEPDTCRLCGSSRQYEMQLMPPLLYFLHQAADGSSAFAPEEWSWMTLIVYTCSKSCCPSSGKEKSNSCSWAVSEEAVIIQDE